MATFTVLDGGCLAIYGTCLYSSQCTTLQSPRPDPKVLLDSSLPLACPRFYSLHLLLSPPFPSNLLFLEVFQMSGNENSTLLCNLFFLCSYIQEILLALPSRKFTESGQFSCLHCGSHFTPLLEYSPYPSPCFHTCLPNSFFN